MNAQVYYGLNIAWGLGNTSVTMSNASGIFQSIEHDLKLDENEVRDQRGNVVAWTGYNPTEEATFEYYISDFASAASGSSAETLGTSVPDRGTKVSVTSTQLVSGSSWIIKDTLLRHTNTEAVKVTLKATRYPAIT